MTTARFVVAAARQDRPRPAPAPGQAHGPGAGAHPGAGPRSPARSTAGNDARYGTRGRAATILRTGTGTPVTPARIAAWQVGLVLAFLTLGRSWPAATAFGCAALLLLALSAIRIRGTWLSALTRIGAGFLLRRRTFPGDHLPLPRGTTIAPDGTLTGPAGVTVVTRTPAWVLPEAGGDGPEIDLQLVVHHRPGRDRPEGWLAITARRDPDTSTDDDQLRLALGNVLRRLRRSGHDLTRLSAADLRAALTAVAHAGPARETWHDWQSGPFTQVTARLTGGRAALLDRLLAEGRDAAVTVAIRACGDGVLRVAATSGPAADRAAARLFQLGASLGLRLSRLDGRHQPALLASLPIGEKLC